MSRSGRSWQLQRRYNDFAQLDEELRAKGSLDVAELPGKESLNPLKLLDPGSFRDKRSDELKAYMQKLAEQVRDRLWGIAVGLG